MTWVEVADGQAVDHNGPYLEAGSLPPCKIHGRSGRFVYDPQPPDQHRRTVADRRELTTRAFRSAGRGFDPHGANPPMYCFG